MIAFFAIITHVFSPDVLAQMQGKPGMMLGLETCHEMQSMDMPDAETDSQDGMAKDHACCKVCLCHPGVTSIPPTLYAATFLLALPGALPFPLNADVTPNRFSTKSSPRGPPSLV